jgi:hypothetical protein
MGGFIGPDGCIRHGASLTGRPPGA